MSKVTSLYRLKKVDIKLAAEVFTRAFEKDPLICYFVPDESKRKEFLIEYFLFRIKYGILYGEVYAPTSKIEGLAVWVPDKNIKMTNWKMFRAGGMRLYKAVDKEKLTLMRSIEKFTSEIHARHINFPHWHLRPIGVDPVHQGQGYARVLMKSMLARFDKEKSPCFLETQSKTNVTIYQKYGFEVVEETTIPGPNLKHWAMVRQPR